MGQQEHAEDYHVWAFVRQVEAFILDEGNDVATFQLLGIRPEELPAIQQPIVGGRVDMRRTNHGA